MRRDDWRYGFALFLAALTVYGLTTYGGVRSSDSEVVFRTCEALATEGSLGIAPLELDPGFGVAPGRSDQQYSVFGPLESLVCVPFYRFWDLTRLAPESVPPSHYIDGGFKLMLERQRSSTGPHRVRFVVSFLTVLVSAANVWIFFLLIRRSCGSPPIAAVLAGLFGFATLNWPYASTFFSEPLAMSLMLLSLLLLVGFDTGDTAAESEHDMASMGGFLAAGFLLGMSATAHLSTVLFAPFFLCYAAGLGASEGGFKTRLLRGAQFAVGYAVPLLLLGIYNLHRFGDLLETGRSVVPDAAARFGYGSWVAPWKGLAGLLISPGKGLLLFCPLVLLGLFAFPALLRRRRVLAVALSAAIGARILVIASRSDWHGGFGVGPRYMLLVVPLLLLPLGAWISERPSAGRLAALLTVGALAAIQQFYFVLGEIFSFYHSIWKFAEFHGRLELLEDIYFDWGFSPLLFLLGGQRGPWTLHGAGVSNTVLIVAFGAIVTASALLFYRFAGSETGQRRPAVD